MLRRFLHLLGLSVCTLEGCQTAGLKPQETKSVPAVPLRRFLHLLGLPNGRLEPPRKAESAGQAQPLPAVPLRRFLHLLNPQEKKSVPAVLCCCGACAPLKAAKRQA